MHINLRLTALFAAAALRARRPWPSPRPSAGRTTRGSTSPRPATTPVPATAAAKAAFAVLARPASADDADNALVARIASQSDIGVDADGRARRRERRPSGRVWLIPANGALCLGLEDTATDSLGISCTLEDAALHDGVTIGDGTQVSVWPRTRSPRSTRRRWPTRHAGGRGESGGASLGTRRRGLHRSTAGHNTVTLDRSGRRHGRSKPTAATLTEAERSECHIAEGVRVDVRTPFGHKLPGPHAS